MLDNNCEVSVLSDVGLNKGITFLHWNSRSMFNKLPEICHILKESKCDIGIFSESWLTNSTTDNMIDLLDYNIIRQDRSPSVNQTRGGGLLIYYKNSLNLELLDNKCRCTRDIELVVLQLKLKQVREIYILCIYRLPSGNVHNFIEILDETILNLSIKTNIEVNLIGDININFNKPRTRETKIYKECLKRHGLVNLITLDTCHNRANSTTSAIDHFCTNNVTLYSQRGICPFDVSDHDIIYASRKKFKVKSGTTKIKVRKYFKLDEKKNFELILTILTGV